mgnify:CR=1 FL=1
MISLAVFASGSGSNAENVYTYFSAHSGIHVTHLISNKREAGVWDRFREIAVTKILINKLDLSSNEFIQSLQKVDFIILAGFLVLIPEELIKAFEHRIINIHPSLLPKYGGKGMYGDHVHQSVLENNESNTGITIHLVNEKYDDGEILFQKSFSILPSFRIEDIRTKIHDLEYENFPKVIEDYCLKLGQRS